VTARARPYPAERILLAGTGAIGVALLPAWVFWIRQHFKLEVRVALTRHAEELVSATSLEVLCGAPVVREGDGVAHLEAASWADAVVVAPATANVLAKAAQGIADDIVTTVVLAADCPVVFVPSLPPAMRAKRATVRNLRRLADDGYGIVPTGEGVQAFDNTIGGGAMADPPAALAFLKRFILARRAETAA
jgi:phosphopantothenoylcysteine decarboxylase/phosphopantothenate--cysteine ligase